jgi:DNA-binding NarL/FixJ family response regulator
MTTTYVYSTHGGATLAHVGNLHGTACGFVFLRYFRVSEDAPPDRTVCARCIEKAHAAAIRQARVEGRLVEEPEMIVERRAREAALRAAHRAALLAARQAEQDAGVVALLKEGLTNVAVARRLRVGLRTAVRQINDAQGRSGAATRFQWGYVVGLAEGCAEGHGES